MDKYAYAYFNSDGTLREFIIDPSVRQGNIGFNKIRFYWESEEPFNALSLSYINTDNEDAQWSEPRVIVKRAVSFSIPAIQDYDPRYFKYGKTYEGYEFSIPEDILSQTGNIALSLFVINQGTRIAYLGMMTIYVSETGASFQSTIDKSQYYYLLDKIQEIANDDGRGGAFIELDSDTGTLDEHELELVGRPATVIKLITLDEDSLYYFDNVDGNTYTYKRHTQGTSEGVSNEKDSFIIIDSQSGSYSKSDSTISFYNKDTVDSLLSGKQNALTFDSTPTENSTNPVTSGGLYNKFESIEELIPAQASSSNQLADKDFVNSSIATNTAYFLGTYDIVSDLGLTTSATHAQVATAIATKLSSLSITVSNNDYVFVSYPDATQAGQYTQFDRYKYNADDVEWDYEYTLNNSSFTAEQWDAINSGITATIVGKIVTTDTAQTITGAKTFNAVTTFGSRVDMNGRIGSDLRPNINNNNDLGSSSYQWKDLYLSGKANLLAGAYMTSNSSGTLILHAGGGSGLVTCEGVYETRGIRPDENGTRDLGLSTRRFKDAYISGNLSNGTDTVTVAHLAQNVLTQWYGTQAEYDNLGTYDSNTIYNILES